MASKRILAFQTPKKRTQTPLRKATRAPAPAVVLPAEGRESLENKLIESYRAENAMLRSLRADSLLYQKLLGISIKEEDDRLGFTIERDSSTGVRRLSFNLESRDDVYVFTLEDSQNCDIPEYFYDVIEFDQKAFPLFFYKAMQAVYETRTN